jgi:hypothetical protein
VLVLTRLYRSIPDDLSKLLSLLRASDSVELSADKLNLQVSVKVSELK